MDSLPYVDTLFKEYLMFRGFTATLQTFGAELAADRCCGFQAEALVELVFGQLLPQCRTGQLMELLDLLADRLYSQLDGRFEGLVERMEVGLVKAALVTCVKAGRREEVSEFFRQHGDTLLSGPEAGLWRQWAALAFVPNPRRDPAFQAYFNPEWLSLLEVSFRNFLSQVLAALPLPAVLRFNADRRHRLDLQQQVESLQRQVEALEQQLADAARAAHGPRDTRAMEEAPGRKASDAGAGAPGAPAGEAVRAVTGAPPEGAGTAASAAAPAPAAAAATAPGEAASPGVGVTAVAAQREGGAQSAGEVAVAPSGAQPEARDAQGADAVGASPVPSSAQPAAGGSAGAGTGEEGDGPRGGGVRAASGGAQAVGAGADAEEDASASARAETGVAGPDPQRGTIELRTGSSGDGGDGGSSRPGGEGGVSDVAPTVADPHRSRHEPQHAQGPHPQGPPSQAQPQAHPQGPQHPPAPHLHPPPRSQLRQRHGRTLSLEAWHSATEEELQVPLDQGGQAFHAAGGGYDPGGGSDGGDGGGAEGSSARGSFFDGFTARPAAEVPAPALAASSSASAASVPAAAGGTVPPDSDAGGEAPGDALPHTPSLPSVDEEEEAEEAAAAEEEQLASGSTPAAAAAADPEPPPPLAAVLHPPGLPAPPPLLPRLQLEGLGQQRAAGLPPHVSAAGAGGGGDGGEEEGHDGAGDAEAAGEGEEDDDPALMLVAGPAESDAGPQRLRRAPEGAGDGFYGSRSNSDGSDGASDHQDGGGRGDDGEEHSGVDGDDGDAAAEERQDATDASGNGGSSIHSGSAEQSVRQPLRRHSGSGSTGALRGARGGGGAVGSGRWYGVGGGAAPPGTLHGRGAAVLAAQFSPGGGANVATGAADGSVAIWLPTLGPGGSQHPSSPREARLACGAPVTCVAWDARADKVMLVGTSSHGILAWHADTRRVAAELPPDPAVPWVTQLACSRKDPVFIVAAATGPPPCTAAAAAAAAAAAVSARRPTALSASSAAAAVLPQRVLSGHRIMQQHQHQQQQVQQQGQQQASASSAGSGVGCSGRLSVWNMRAFKRVSSYAVPQDAPVLSLAYNAQGSWFAAGTTCGAVHLYDSNASGSRPQPLSTFRANTSPPGSAAAPASAPAAVQVYDNGSETLLATCCAATVRLWSLRRLSEPLLSVPLLPYLPYGGGGDVSSGADGGGWSAEWAPCMCLSPRGAAAAVVLGGGGPAVYLVDLEGNTGGGQPDEATGGAGGAGWLTMFGAASAATGSAAASAASAAAAATAGRVSVIVPYSGDGGARAAAGTAAEYDKRGWRLPEYSSDGEAAVYGSSCCWHPGRDVLVVGYSDGAVQTVGLSRGHAGGGGG